MFNSFMKHLVIKDILLFKKQLAFYFISGLVSIVIINIPVTNFGHLGSVLLITSMVALYCHILIVCVVQERKENQTIFMMTLPITISTYSVSKLVSSTSMFLSVWIVMLGITMGSVYWVGKFPPSYLSFYVVIFGVFIPAFFFILAVALSSRSIAWTIVATVISNVSVTSFIDALQNRDEYRPTAALNSINEVGLIWPPVANSLIVSELLVTIIICVFIFLSISKEKEFI